MFKIIFYVPRESLVSKMWQSQPKQKQVKNKHKKTKQNIKKNKMREKKIFPVH